MEPTSLAKPPRRFRFQFGLKWLLLAMLLVAVYLAGRSSMTYRNVFAPKIEGNWTATMPRGHQRTVTVQNVGDGRYTLATGGVLSGTYEWQNGKLVVVQPGDSRMVGLVWTWDGEKLILTGEPANTPTGSSYTGATLTRP
ncbi:MAG TPA: hypothetical protein VFV87_00310 [Pirellulaceae bacterium]|nr:hypothetical protein [Pirellulaceae bacterium]